MNNTEEDVIQTPLTETFQRLKMLAQETGLLYVMDVEALEKLAALNQLQQQADKLDERAPEQIALRNPFNRLYSWLHEVNKYFIYRDYPSGGIWRLGTFLSKRGGQR
jgi:hypothetical protein